MTLRSGFGKFGVAAGGGVSSVPVVLRYLLVAGGGAGTTYGGGGGGGGWLEDTDGSTPQVWMTGIAYNFRLGQGNLLVNSSYTDHAPPAGGYDAPKTDAGQPTFLEYGTAAGGSALVAYGGGRGGGGPGDQNGKEGGSGGGGGSSATTGNPGPAGPGLAVESRQEERQRGRKRDQQSMQIPHSWPRML